MNQWTRMELPNGTEEGTSSLPPVGKDAALYLIPRQRGRAWMFDIGRLYFEANLPRWESAIGIGSRLDGGSFHALLRTYDIWFADAPPLINGRVPPGFATTEKET